MKKYFSEKGIHMGCPFFLRFFGDGKRVKEAERVGW